MIKAVIFDCFGVLLDVVSNQRDERVIEFVRSLKDDYKLAMMSNVSSRATLDGLFRPGELDALFDVVVASGDIGVEKPQPRIFWHTLEQLDVLPEEALFVDDIARFVEGGRACGLEGIVFESADKSLPVVRELLG